MIENDTVFFFFITYNNCMVKMNEHGLENL